MSYELSEEGIARFNHHKGKFDLLSTNTINELRSGYGVIANE